MWEPGSEGGRGRGGETEADLLLNSTPGEGLDLVRDQSRGGVGWGLEARRGGVAGAATRFAGSEPERSGGAAGEEIRGG